MHALARTRSRLRVLLVATATSALLLVGLPGAIGPTAASLAPVLVAGLDGAILSTTVTLRVVDTEGRPLGGAAFEISDGVTALACQTAPESPGGVLLGDPAAGECRVVFPVSAGSSGFSYVQTAAPAGYVAAAPGDGPNGEGPCLATCGLGDVVNERIDRELEVVGGPFRPADGERVVGDAHTFTVRLRDGDGSPLPNEPLDAAWTGVGSIVEATGVGSPTVAGAAASCLTLGDGTCTFTVSATAPGTGTLVATHATPYQHATTTDPLPSATDGAAAAAISDDASSTWLGYGATISPDRRGLVGDRHAVLVHTYEVDGRREPAPIGFVDVVATWVGPTGSTLDTSECTSDRSGLCIFEVRSDVAGMGTFAVTNLADGRPRIGAPIDHAVDGPSANATWLDVRATIDADSVNGVGATHDFAVLVETDDGAGWTPAGEGIVVAHDWTGPGAVGAASTTCDDGTDAAGTCIVSVSSGSAGTGTLTLTHAEGGPLSEFERSVAVADTATKTWLDHVVDISDNAAELVDDEHTFTVSVASLAGDDAAPTAAPDGSHVVLSLSGDGATVLEDTCATTGTVAGACTITISRETVGITTVSVDSFEALDVDEVDGKSVVIDLGQREMVVSASVIWVGVGVDISAPAFEPLRGEHAFTIDVHLLDPATPAGRPAPDGTTLAATFSGVGDVVADTCAAPGTVDGRCTVTVRSDGPGTTTAGLDSVTVVYVGGAPPPVVVGDGGPIVAARTFAPQARAPRLPPVPPTSLTALLGPDAGTTSVTWAAFRAAISGDAHNVVGDPHTFDVTNEYTIDGVTWSAVPDGSVVTFQSDGDGDDVSHTCAATVGGGCSVTVASDVAGTRSVTVTGLATTLAHAGLTEEFGIVWSGRRGVPVTADLPIASVATWRATAPAIDVRVAAVVGQGPGDGDLLTDLDDPTPLLWFTTEDPRTAVYELVITNVGDVTLVDVTLDDDRLGLLLRESDGVTLAPGESRIVRSSETYLIDDATFAPGTLVANRAFVTGRTPRGALVTDSDDELIRVLSDLDTRVLGAVLEREPAPLRAPDPDVVQPELAAAGSEATPTLLMLALLLLAVGALILRSTVRGQPV